MTLADEKYLLLTTFKRDGTPVATPVWAAPMDSGAIGFWSSTGSGKAKRLAHTSRVTVQPCDARGRTKAGSTVTDATAVVVKGAQFEEITKKINAKYGFMTKVTKVLGMIGGIVKRNRIPYGDCGVVVTLS